MTGPTVADVLRRAADEIDRRGHCKGNLVDPAGHVCSIGAINCAASGSPHHPDRDPDADVALGAIFAFEKYLNRAIVDWNDDPDRTADEVKAALLAAAGKAAEL